MAENEPTAYEHNAAFAENEPTAYEHNAAFAQRAFAPHLQGPRLACVCVVSEQPLGDEARRALESSAAKLEYGANACCFLSLEPLRNQTAFPESSHGNPSSNVSAAELESTSEPARLSPSQLFIAVESIDPLCLVLADAASVQACASAYQQSITPDRACRVFCRPAVAFASFSALLESPAGKQHAWALLKAALTRAQSATKPRAK